MWRLGTDEESQNSIDLTQISMDVRNLPFEDLNCLKSKVKAALRVCGGLNGFFFNQCHTFGISLFGQKIILSLY